MAIAATGVSISLPMLSGLLTSCRADAAGDDYEALYFTHDELQWLKEFVDIILPATDSPAASEVGIHLVIDSMMGLVHAPDDKAAYRQRFAALQAYFDEAKDPLPALRELATSTDEAMESAREAFLDLRGKTIAYYLTDEEIATNYLNYLPVPGEYQPCISVEEAGGKAWAL